jgi:preprotein translocase subunit YajC
MIDSAVSGMSFILNSVILNNILTNTVKTVLNKYFQEVIQMPLAAIVQLVLPMALILGLMYVMLILPQKKREKKTQQMLNSLQVGMAVITIGGVAGKIVNIKDDEVYIESGVEKSKILVKRWAIKEVSKPMEG